MNELVEMLNFITIQAKRIADSLESIQLSLGEIKTEIVDAGVGVVIMDHGDSIQDRLHSIVDAIECAACKEPE